MSTAAKLQNISLSRVKAESLKAAIVLDGQLSSAVVVSNETEFISTLNNNVLYTGILR